MFLHTREAITKMTAVLIVVGMIAAAGVGSVVTYYLTRPPPAAPVELTFTHDKPMFQDAIVETFEPFTEETGIEINIVPYASVDIYQGMLRPLLGTEKAPDLFTWWSGTQLQEMVDGGYVADLTSIKEKIGDKVPEGLWDPVTFDGTVCAIPGTNVGYWAVWYGIALFEEHGWEEPTTWDEFLTLCEDIKAEGIIPIGLAGGWWWPGFVWFEDLLIRVDPDFYERLMVGNESYTDPKVHQAMEVWKDMLEKGYFGDPEELLVREFEMLASMMATGEIAMCLNGDWISSLFEGAGWGPEDYGVFVLPNVNPEVGNVMIAEVSPIIVSSSSPHLEEAIKAAEYWLSAEAQELYCGLLGFIPPNVDVPTDILPPAKAKLVETAIEGDYRLVTRYWEAHPPDISHDAIDKFNEFIAHPERLDQILQDIEDTASAYWEAHPG